MTWYPPEELGQGGVAALANLNPDTQMDGWTDIFSSLSYTLL